MDDQDSALAEILKQRKIQGEVGPFDYQIGMKNAQIQGNLKDAFVKALLKYKGGWNLNAHMPLVGGQLGLDASKGDDGNKQIYLQYQKNF